MDPVEIWEGIDTREETGRNRLTKLAIHILSVVANSAGCERAFSHMGLVHTTIRSRLNLERVRKATAVGMDLKRTHIEAGLLRAQTRRNFNFGSAEAGEQDTGPSDASDDQDLGGPLDFNQLSEQLIAGAASASSDKDVGDAYSSGDDDDELPSNVVSAPPLTITIPPLNLNSATRSALPNTPAIVAIPLKILFKYPADKDLPSDGMNTFWSGGIQNLERELEAYELLNGSGEPGGSEDSETAEINYAMHEIPDNMNY